MVMKILTRGIGLFLVTLISLLIFSVVLHGM